MTNQNHSKYHVVMLLGGKMEHFTSNDPAQVLKLVAEMKPAHGYLLFRGAQLRSILDIWQLMGLTTRDLPTLGEVAKWEEKWSQDDEVFDGLEEEVEEEEQSCVGCGGGDCTQGCRSNRPQCQRTMHNPAGSRRRETFDEITY